MTWMISGGCGFVGANLTNALLGAGEDVVVLDNLSRVGAYENLVWLRHRHGRDWRFVEADIRDADVVSRTVQGAKPDVFAHLAGQVAMTTSLNNPRLDCEINVLGSLNVLEAVRLHSPNTTVLYSSTNKVYGDLQWVRCEEGEKRYVTPDYPEGFDELTPLCFQSPYGCSKGAADQYMLDYARIFGLRTVVFRHSSIYGGRQFATYDQGWIGWFCQKALEMSNTQMSEFTISGNGKQVRDVLHVDDVIAIYLAAARHIGHMAGQAYNVGGGPGNSLSLLELFELLEATVGVPMRFRKLEWRTNDQRVFIANNGKALADVDWRPSVAIEDGLRYVLEWSRETVNMKSSRGQS